ncbi:MAG: hypothetical protein JWO20_1161 [Candidatus Angelobacter sp.]|nr:hypothetical protein [Candidatus Angelobacter sp.]
MMTTKLKRFSMIASGVAVLMMSAMLSAQTLADAARAAQKNKRTTSATEKVYTNDSLGFHPGSGDATKDAKKTEDNADSKADSKSDKGDDSSAADDKKKAAEELKTKYEKQKSDLTQLQRELDVMERENRLRGATFYADAGNRLRDEKKYAEDDRKYQSDVAAKKKAIADANAALDKMKDEGRKTGVPLS